MVVAPNYRRSTLHAYVVNGYLTSTFASGRMEGYRVLALQKKSIQSACVLFCI